MGLRFLCVGLLLWLSASVLGEEAVQEEREGETLGGYNLHYLCPYGKKVLYDGGRIARRDYRDNERLCWVLKCTGEYEKVFLKFDAFETEAYHDFLKLFKIHDYKLIFQDKWSGKLHYPKHAFHSSKGLVAFHSDEKVGGDGFRFQWLCKKVMPPPPPPPPQPQPKFPKVCPNGYKVLRNPGVGDNNPQRVARRDYRDNERLCWVLVCETKGTYAYLEFDTFETQAYHDFLKFFKIRYGPKLVFQDKWSGKLHYPKHAFHSMKGLVAFHSDEKVGGDGFRFRWFCKKYPPHYHYTHSEEEDTI